MLLHVPSAMRPTSGRAPSRSLSRFPARTASAIQAADELAAQHVPNWTAVREQVIEKLIQHPQWLLDANGQPSAANLGCRARRSDPRHSLRTKRTGIGSRRQGSGTMGRDGFARRIAPTSLLEGVVQLLQTPEHHRLSSDKLLDKWALSRAGFSETDARAIVRESDEVSRTLELVEGGHPPREALRIVWGEQGEVSR